MTAPRACPDPWTAIEDHYSGLMGEQDPMSWGWFALSLLAAGALGLGVTWLLLRVSGWLQP